MKTYRNINWTKRDYECTNIVACVASETPAANWVECDPSYIANMQQLWIERDVRYYGWL